MADEVTSIGDVWVDSWFTIWYRPRATMRRIVDADPTRFVLGIAWLTGALWVLAIDVMTSATTTSERIPQLRFEPLGTAISALIVGVANVFSIYLVGALLRWSGAILGGTASTNEVRAALVWSQVPQLFLLVVFIIATVLGLNTWAGSPSMSVFNFFESIVGLCVMVISLKCLGEVHRFSAWRALSAFLLGIFATIAVVVAIVATVSLAMRFGRALV